ncbi:cytochrome P450 2C70-like [Mercenaria mercenaria]|uniref:cytochrome P450 2C70-like n=1 Tax=Mercenaria mercenaria TaxID=6596 RepID=UPI00234EC45F|nr:cytochrome P450 2C70-like [Mercenaria mercenaria]
MLHILLTIFGLIIALIFLTKGTKRTLKGLRIPGPTGIPVFGSLFSVNIENTHEKFSDFARIYGDICQVKLFNYNVVLLNSEVLIKATSAQIYKEYLNDRSETFYGEKVLFGSQSTAFYKNGYCTVHDNLRKGFAKAAYLFGPSFERNILDQIENDLAKKIEVCNGEEFEFTSKLQLSLTKMLAFALTGKIYNDDDNDLAVFREYTDMESYSPGEIRGFVDYYLERQRADMENGEEIFFTDERIICQILELSASVMLTTWGTIVNTFFLLVNFPIYQDMIFEQLDRIFGRKGDIKYSDKTKCPILEAVEMEVHRYLTGFPLLLPRKNSTHLEFEGYDLPKDSISLKPKIEILEVESQSYDILVFTETWLNMSVVSADLLLPNFQPPFRCDRMNRIGGGVAIYVREGIIASERVDLAITGLGALWFELIVNKRKIILGGIYRPPDSNNNHWLLLEQSIDQPVV